MDQFRVAQESTVPISKDGSRSPIAGWRLEVARAHLPAAATSPKQPQARLYPPSASSVNVSAAAWGALSHTAALARTRSPGATCADCDVAATVDVAGVLLEDSRVVPCLGGCGSSILIMSTSVSVSTTSKPAAPALGLFASRADSSSSSSVRALFLSSVDIVGIHLRRYESTRH